MERKIITRAEAKAQGLSRYFTGKPCLRGHVAERYTGTKQCVECNRERCARYYARDPVKSKADRAAYYVENQEKIRAAVQDYAARNKEKVAAANKAKYERYKRDHPDRLQRYSEKSVAIHSEQRREYNRRYRSTEEGKAKRAAYEAWRRSRKQNATPPWADRDKIEAFYMARPEGYEVDHIIPLKGKLVSGLHVLDNLQYLAMSDNRKKHAQFLQEAFTTEKETRSVSNRI
jgi:hypothetical protein